MSDESNELFGEARSLTNAPSEENFQELLQLLEGRQLPPSLLPYLQRSLRAWPEDIPRAMPERWIEPILDEQPLPPTASLLGTLRINHHRANRTTAQLLARTTHLQLRVLDLTRSAIGEDGARYLAGAQHLRSLRELYLEHCQIGTHGAWLLARSPILENLHTLSLKDNAIADRGIQPLGDTVPLDNLRKLDLARNDLDSDAMRTLASSTFLGRLEHLDLHWNGIRDAGLQHLCESQKLENLRFLDLGACSLNPGSISHLCQAYLPQLSSLSLRRNSLNLSAVIQLADSRLLRQLRHLGLGFMRLNLEALRALLSRDLSNLTHLSLAGSTLDPQAAEAIAQASSLHNLRWLNLSKGTNILEDGAALIAQSPQLPKLQHLHIDTPQLNGLDYLQGFPGHPSSYDYLNPPQRS